MSPRFPSSHDNDLLTTETLHHSVAVGLSDDRAFGSPIWLT
jgi:hypothetical protein